MTSKFYKKFMIFGHKTYDLCFKRAEWLMCENTKGGVHTVHHQSKILHLLAQLFIPLFEI